MKKTAIFLTVLFLVAYCLAGCGETPSASSKTATTNGETNSTEDTTDTDVSKEEITIKRGINLSALEDKLKQSKYLYNEETYTNLASQGFDHIRLPVDFRNYADKEGVLDDDKMQDVDKIIEMANNHGLVVFLDFHGWYDLNTTIGDDLYFIKIWRSVAERYKDYGKNHMLIFELINEPHIGEGGNLNMTTLDYLQWLTADIIRGISPDRTICVATAEWNGSWTLNADHAQSFRKTKISTYENIIVAVHTYAPIEWTHQDMVWAGTGGKTAKLTDESIEALKKDLNELVNFTKETGIPVILNEFGFNTNTSTVPIEDQVRYVETVVDALNEYDIPFTWWEYNGEFGLYRKTSIFGKAEWSEKILEVMFK